MIEHRIDAPPRVSWALVPAALVSISAVMLFGFQLSGWGHLVLAAGGAVGVAVGRGLGIDLLLIRLGGGILSTTPVEADVAWGSFFRIGIVLALAVSVPFLLDRFALRRRVIRFPWRSREKKTRLEIVYLFAVPFLGWLILPFYFIRSGAYLNWPHIT